MKNNKSLEELPEHYKIIRVRASDMSPSNACYFIASSIEMAEKKAELMTYRNPRGEEITLDSKISNEYYFKAGLEHALNHKPCGDPSCDAFLICYKHDDEEESEESMRRKGSDKESKEAKAKQEFYKMLL